MEQLNNEFRVGVSAAETWKVLTDVERIAPLLPGAQLQEIDGDEFRGIVKVKVGPITAQYKGTASFLEKDEAAGKVVLKASGRDTRGQGNASATISVTMSPDGDGTHVAVVTDLQITGKVAQFGRGVLADVSSKLLGQFVDSLEADLAATAAGDGGPGGGGSPEAPPAPDVETVNGNGSAPAADVAAGPRRIESKEAEPLDLLAVAGGSTMKRAAPIAAVVAVVLAILLRRRLSR